MVNATVDNDVITEFIEPSNTFKTTSIESNTDTADGLAWGDSGTRLYFCDGGNSQIDEYTASTPYDINSISLTNQYDISTEVGTNGLGFDIKPDGTKIWIGSGSSKTIQEYNLSTAWSTASASAGSSYSFNKPRDQTEIRGLSFNSTGDVLITTHRGDTIHKHALSTPYDITTASYDTESGLFPYSDIRHVNHIDDSTLALSMGGEFAKVVLPTANDVSTPRTANRFSETSIGTGGVALNTDASEWTTCSNSGGIYRTSTTDPGTPVSTPQDGTYKIDLKNVSGTLYIGGFSTTATGTYILKGGVGVSATSRNFINGFQIK